MGMKDYRQGLDMNSSRKENIIQNATCAVHVNKKELNHNY